jgi:hypothetical protein
MKTDYIRKPMTPEQKERRAEMDRARHLKNRLKKLHDNEDKTPIQSIEDKTPIQSIEDKNLNPVIKGPVYMDYDTSKYSNDINTQLQYARENYPIFKYNEILKYTLTKY